MSGRVVGALHTGLQVRDLERSVAFYRDLLGFEVTLRRVVADPYIGTIVGCPGVEIHEAFLAIPGSEHQLELLEYRNAAGRPVDPATANPGTAHLCVLVDDLAAVHARLSAAGARFVSAPVAPTVGPNVGGLVVYLLDPDEIRVELIQPPAR